MSEVNKIGFNDHIVNGKIADRNALIAKVIGIDLFGYSKQDFVKVFNEILRVEGLLKKQAIVVVQAYFERGEMPVFSTGIDTFCTVSPSAQQEGYIQVTRYNVCGIFGDSQYRTIEEALNDNGLATKAVLDEDEGNDRLAVSLAAEAGYQERYKARMSGCFHDS